MQPAIPDSVVLRLGARHAAVARELERLLDAVQELAASAERSVTQRGEAATLAWLGRVWREVDRELHWCSSLPREMRYASAPVPVPAPRRRRDEIGFVVRCATPDPTPVGEP